MNRIICWFKGHNWNGGAGGWNYQYLHCKRCNQNIYSIRDGNFYGSFKNGRVVKSKSPSSASSDKSTPQELKKEK